MTLLQTTVENICAMFQCLATQNLLWELCKLVSSCSFHFGGWGPVRGMQSQRVNQKSKIFSKIILCNKYRWGEEILYYCCSRRKAFPKMCFFKDLKYLFFNQQLVAKVSKSVAALSWHRLLSELRAQGNSQNHILNAPLRANTVFKGSREMKGSPKVWYKVACRSNLVEESTQLLFCKL